MKLPLLALAAAVFCCSCGQQEETPKSTSSRPAILDTNNRNIVHTPVNPLAPVDISPMDMAYLPSDYPILKMAHKTTDMPVARVIYSRPQKQNREIFGKLLKYGTPWRLGANEGTEIEFFKNVKVEDRTVPKGRYVIFCIPYEHNWDIILNSNLYSWGLTEDTTRNLYKFNVPVQDLNYPIEYFTMAFRDTAGHADLVMAWDKTEARLPISY